MNLYQFQQEAVDKFFKSGSLLVSITTGGGKTVVALEIIRRFLKKNSNFRCLIISPANLRQNFVQNIEKFKLKINSCIVTDKSQFEDCYKTFNVLIVSYNFLRLYFQSVIFKFNWDLVICDELHYAKNTATVNYKTILQLRQRAKHFLGLTASPLMNDPKEFFAIVSIVANDLSILKEGLKLIKYKKIGETPLWKTILFGKKSKPQLIPVGVTDVEKFKQLLQKWVYIPEYTKLKGVTNRPEVKSYLVNVNLTKFEISAYKYALRSIPKHQLKELQQGTITDHELRAIRNSIIACQQTLLSPDYIYNYTTEELSVNISRFRPGSKIIKAGEILKVTGDKSIVYSPFLIFGARLANQYFNTIGIKSAEYSGHVKQLERQKLVDQFEHGDLQVLCLTGAGQEGLNLPSCKNVLFLTLAWNQEVLRQVLGRALRITSKNKFVNVIWLFATINGKETIDHWMSRIIKRKALIRNVIFEILSEQNVSASLTGYEIPVGKPLRRLSWDKKDEKYILSKMP